MLAWGNSSNGTVALVPLTTTWATKPAAASNTGGIIRVTDVGGGNPGPSGGNLFLSNGVRWRPLNGFCLLDAIDTANVGTATTAEQQLNPNHVIVQAGLIANYDRLRLWLSISKSGTSDTCTLQIKYGPLGTTADPVIATISALTGANQSYGTVLEFKRISATSLQKQGNADPSSNYNGASAGAYPAAVTVSNMDSNGMYMSVTATMTSGTEIPTIQDFTLEMYASDS